MSEIIKEVKGKVLSLEELQSRLDITDKYQELKELGEEFDLKKLAENIKSNVIEETKENILNLIRSAVLNNLDGSWNKIVNEINFKFNHSISKSFIIYRGETKKKNLKENIEDKLATAFWNKIFNIISDNDNLELALEIKYKNDTVKKDLTNLLEDKLTPLIEELDNKIISRLNKNLENRIKATKGRRVADILDDYGWIVSWNTELNRFSVVEKVAFEENYIDIRHRNNKFYLYQTSKLTLEELEVYKEELKDAQKMLEEIENKFPEFIM